MSPSRTSEAPNRPRVGIPWRTSKEEAEKNFPEIDTYRNAVAKAGGEPVLLSLVDPQSLRAQLNGLQGFVLPGSPADVNPASYGSADKGLCAAPDAPREETDNTILRHAFAEKKPVLAICYGCQSLNVHLGGTLIQDVRSETGTTMAHRKKDLAPPPPDDPRHEAKFAADSHLAAVLGSTRAEINSSHHQAVEKAGKGLRVAGHAPDGTIEAVEWTGDANWVLGVQWHPERMFGDRNSELLFEDFVAAARKSQRAHQEATK